MRVTAYDRFYKTKHGVTEMESMCNAMLYVLHFSFMKFHIISLSKTSRNLVSYIEVGT
jgi:hypothetical protein